VCLQVSGWVGDLMGRRFREERRRVKSKSNRGERAVSVGVRVDKMVWVERILRPLGLHMLLGGFDV